MTLTALQAYDIKKALIAGNTIDAVKQYREATGCSLVEAKAVIDGMKEDLQSQKSWQVKEAPSASPANSAIKPVSRIKGLIIFLLIDALIFAGVIYYFFLRETDTSHRERQLSLPQTVENTVQSQGRPKAATLPSQVSPDSYTAPLDTSDTYASLYQQKLGDPSYIRRKNAGDTAYDGSTREKKIKTARSALASVRQAPTGAPLLAVPHHAAQPNIEGIIGEAEWAGARRLVLDTTLNTTLLLKTDGEWLFIACDAPAEISSGGYDQLRIYFHAGLVDGLANERVHIGRGSGITSIRQTGFRWQGDPPDNDNERWKKYAVSDWGIYRHAYGASSMSNGHRQYEAAVHLGEAGLPRGVPFTIYAEVETDPLKNDQGKFVERQYLGELGSAENPVWIEL